jgi:hypothetical protein
VRVEGKRAGDESIEACVHRLARGGDEIDARERAEFRADENGGSPLRLALHEPPFGPDIFAGPRVQRREADRVALLGLVDASRAQMLQHHGSEVRRWHNLVQPTTRARAGVDEVNQLLLVGGNDSMRREALDGKRARDPHS